MSISSASGCHADDNLIFADFDYCLLLAVEAVGGA
jgi:hypothetical protein